MGREKQRTVSSEKQKKDCGVWRCSPVLAPEAPSSSLPPLLLSAAMCSPLLAPFQTARPSCVAVPETWLNTSQEQAFIFWPRPQ